MTKSFWVIHKTQKSYVNLAAFEDIRNFLSTSGYFSYIDNLVGNISRYSRKESVRWFPFGKLETSGNLRIYGGNAASPCRTRDVLCKSSGFLKVSEFFCRLWVIFHTSTISLAIFKDIHETNRFVGLNSGSLKLAESCINMAQTRSAIYVHHPTTTCKKFNWKISRPGSDRRGASLQKVYGACSGIFGKSRL